jgi:hypothetical protein
MWECTLEEFIEKVVPVLQEHIQKNKLHIKVVKLAISFLRIHFEEKTLPDTVEKAVSKSIEEALIYYVNIMGEDV